MIHPANGHRYQFIYEHPDYGWLTMWSSWHICRPETALDDIQRSLAAFQSHWPGQNGKLLWLNLDTRQWEEVTLGKPVNSKYALFSED